LTEIVAYFSGNTTVVRHFKLASFSGLIKPMAKNFLLTILLLNFTGVSSFGQVNDNYLLWSADYKLTVEDFAIKTKLVETTPSFAQFSLDYQVSGFDFLTKNFNKKVRNNFIRSASWIDTTIDFSRPLRYQQTLFDLCEIYARQFRKALKENKRKIAKGIAIAQQLNEQFMSEFAQRRIYYDTETKFGIDETKQKDWELQIQKELTELANYAYDK
jgi:hypothetical protein